MVVFPPLNVPVDSLMSIEGISGSNFADYIMGGTANEWLSGFGGNDMINGGAGDDNVRGETGNDTVIGDVGNDTVSGGEGSDIVGGGSGNDDLNGGDGADILNGHSGYDVLTGGEGSDIFIFRAGNNTDFITDFAVSDDKIVLSLPIQPPHLAVQNTYMNFMQNSWMEGNSTIYQNQFGDTLVLYGVDRSALTINNFVLDGYWGI